MSSPVPTTPRSKDLISIARNFFYRLLSCSYNPNIPQKRFRKKDSNNKKTLTTKNPAPQWDKQSSQNPTSTCSDAKI